jgi:hypothetical protein
MVDARPPTQHVKATLPPSVYFPGEAEIRYYLKATVNRPSLLKENPRQVSTTQTFFLLLQYNGLSLIIAVQYANFSFVPIELPRPASDGETYARRQHQFMHDSPPPLPARQGSGFVEKLKKASSVPTSPSIPPPPARFSVDARLPNPAILTCTQDIPLRVLIKQLSERSEALHLQTLQIELVGYTRVRAHEVNRTETNSWVIASLSNINMPIGNPSDVEGTETELSKEFWYGHKLPDTVAPSFVTCNIARSYELVVSVGLAYGSLKASMGMGVVQYIYELCHSMLTLVQNHFIVLPLRLNVEVFSGIKPPPDLLKRMESIPSNPAMRPPSEKINPPAYGTPVGSSSQLPPQPVSGDDDAPPSYEDAIASELPPINGPRPGYRPPAAPEGESRITGDEKRR